MQKIPIESWLSSGSYLAKKALQLDLLKIAQKNWSLVRLRESFALDYASDSANGFRVFELVGI